MNQAVFVGRLCRDMSLRKIGEDHRVLNNTIAINRPHRDRNGETVTDYIPIVVWDHLADLLHNNVQKGSQISVSGLMQSRNYVNKEGLTVYVVECLVTEVTLIDRKNKVAEDKTVAGTKPSPTEMATQAHAVTSA